MVQALRAGSTGSDDAAARCNPAAGDASGWSLAALATTAGARLSLDAKIAALAALTALPPRTPVATVAYASSGRLLVIADDANMATQALLGMAQSLTVALLWTATTAAPKVDDAEIVSGKLLSLRGYLGAFELVFAGDVAAPPQVASFDLVLDLRVIPHFAMHQPPQGYLHAADSTALAAAMVELPEMIGEFEKPKFFAYKATLCAHSRSKKTGCNNCIEVCSAQAISSAGDTVVVDPHLCMGCGACATVCPSGAMTYQYPQVADRGSELKALLHTYRTTAKGQGTAPVVLFHNASDGRVALDALAAAGVGLGANVLPLETWHVAAIGLDVLLGAVAYGAGQVAVLAAGSEAPEYVAALQSEMALGESILHALGFAGTHFSVLQPTQDATAWQTLTAGETVAVPAGFNLSNDKRSTIEFAVEHLLRHAKSTPEIIALPVGSLFGGIEVDKQKCTMCLACAGACPSSALMDGGEVAALKFLERNCVQCGLCEKTCPENAITLVPRLLLTAQRKATVVLNDAEPFDCISCGKTLGTKQMIAKMLGMLATHSMFQGDGKLQRLQMCADCRVVDMMGNKEEYSILTGKSLGAKP